MKKYSLVCLLALCGLFAFSSTNLFANAITFEIRSHHPNIVQLEFYSQNRPHAWPGGNSAYELRDSQYHAYTLDCFYGEQICYGAWVKGNENTYWGTGMNDSYSCHDCCGMCDGQTFILKTLTP